MFDHFEAQALLLCGFGGVRTCVALVNLSHLDCPACGLLHLCGQRYDLVAMGVPCATKVRIGR